MREVNPDNLGAASADIEYEQTIARGIEQRRTARNRQPRLVSGSDNIKVKPGFADHPFHKLCAVDGSAAGFRSDSPSAGHAPLGHFIRTDFQGGNRAIHGGGGKFVRFFNPFAQPDNPRESIENFEAVAIRARDHQAAIIGSQIERGIDMPLRFAFSGAKLLALGR